jgi:hypothetical protein
MLIGIFSLYMLRGSFEGKGCTWIAHCVSLVCFFCIGEQHSLFFLVVLIA